MIISRSSSIFVTTKLLPTDLWPLDVENFQLTAVSAHFLAVLKWNLVYRFILIISRSRSILGNRAIIDKVMAIRRKIIPVTCICIFRSFSLQRRNKFEWNLVYRLIMVICSSCSIFGTIKQLSIDLWSLDVEKFQLFAISFSLQRINVLKWSLVYRLIMIISRSSWYWIFEQFTTELCAYVIVSYCK